MEGFDIRSPRASPTPPVTPPPSAPPLHHPQPRRPNDRAAVLPSPGSVPTARPIPHHANTMPQAQSSRAQEPARAQTVNSQPQPPASDSDQEGDLPARPSSTKSLFGAIAKGVMRPLSRRRERREAHEAHVQRVNGVLRSGTGHLSLENLLRAEAIEEEVRRARDRGPQRRGLGRDRGASESGLPDHLVKVGYDVDEGVHHVVDTKTGRMTTHPSR